MSMANFAEQFAMKAEKVDAEITSTTNWHGVRDLIAEQIGLDRPEVYVTTISKPGNVSPRFRQSKAAVRASVLVGMHTDRPTELPGTVSAAKEIATERGASAIIAMRESGVWLVVAILRPKGDERLDPVAQCYPGAMVLPV